MNYVKNIFSINYKGFSYNPLILGILIFIFIRVIVWLQFDFSNTLSGDATYYLSVAENIVNHGQHFDPVDLMYSYRAPGYPFFLSLLLYWDVPINALNIYIIQSLLLFITYITVFFLVKNIKPKSSGVVFLLLCLVPFDAVYNGKVISETLLSCFVLLSSVLILFFHKRAFYGYILPAILLGFLTLTKDIFLFLPFLIAVFMLFKKSQLNYIILFILSYCCVISPWVVRNATLPTDSFIGISQGIFWPNLWVGQWLQDDVGLSSALKQGFIQKDQMQMFEEKWKYKIQNQDFWREQALSNFKNMPIKILSNWTYRIPKMWVGTRTDLMKMRFDTGSSYWYLSKLSFFVMNIIISILFFTLLFVGILRRDRAAFLSLIFIIYLIGIYMPFYNIETRYSQPILGIMLFYLGFSRIIIKDLISNARSWFKRS
jgi:hypothetical protein